MGQQEHSLLAEIQNDTAVLEDTVAISHKTKKVFLYDLTMVIYLKELKKNVRFQ